MRRGWVVTTNVVSSWACESTRNAHGPPPVGQGARRTLRPVGGSGPQGGEKNAHRGYQDSSGVVWHAMANGSRDQPRRACVRTRAAVPSAVLGGTSFQSELFASRKQADGFLKTPTFSFLLFGGFNPRDLHASVRWCQPCEVVPGSLPGPQGVLDVVRNH